MSVPKEVETRRGSMWGTMSALTSSRREARKTAAALREQLREVEMQISLEESSDVLHTMSCGQDGSSS